MFDKNLEQLNMYADLVKDDYKPELISEGVCELHDMFVCALKMANESYEFARDCEDAISEIHKHADHIRGRRGELMWDFVAISLGDEDNDEE